jgi:DNA helicase HerA-like ATPase
VLAIVSALSVPVPSQREGDGEVWIAELGLVGELLKTANSPRLMFNRGVTVYPALGDRVRVAVKAELEAAFCGDGNAMVRIGCIRQDSTIPAMIRVDELLGKHFAVLGTTGTGKSCTTALILRSILEQNPAAHIVLLDPHNEYATAFTEWAEVISPRNMQLPYWLLTFEEIVEVLVGDSERKAEIEVLQDLIPLAKARYNSGRSSDTAKLRRSALDSSRFTVDTPVPYRISDLVSLIDDRMGKLENKRDLASYRNLKHRIESMSQDGRYAFMFGSLTVYDGMTQVLGRIFRVPVNNKPITILELTGIPSEIVNVVVSVLCRMTFDFALWSEGQLPVTLVCEEAHRYVPANAALGFEPCKRAIAKIAKEGRKYGASLCVVTQRPAEIDPTILSQCNTVFALRMSNDRDQAIVQSAVSDTGSGLLEFLPSLGQREAIAFGDGMSLPVRIKFDELPKSALPRSSTARFSERWQKSLGDDGFLEQIVERWRASGIPASSDTTQNISMMADAIGIAGNPEIDSRTLEEPEREAPAPPPHAPLPPSVHHGGLARQQGSTLRREATPAAAPAFPLPRAGGPPPMGDRNSLSPAMGGQSQNGGPATATSVGSLRSLRDRLSRPSG